MDGNFEGKQCSSCPVMSYRAVICSSQRKYCCTSSKASTECDPTLHQTPGWKMDEIIYSFRKEIWIYLKRDLSVTLQPFYKGTTVNGNWNSKAQSHCIDWPGQMWCCQGYEKTNPQMSCRERRVLSFLSSVLLKSQSWYSPDRKRDFSLLNSLEFCTCLLWFWQTFREEHPQRAAPSGAQCGHSENENVLCNSLPISDLGIVEWRQVCELSFLQAGNRLQLCLPWTHMWWPPQYLSHRMSAGWDGEWSSCRYLCVLSSLLHSAELLWAKAWQGAGKKRKIKKNTKKL